MPQAEMTKVQQMQNNKLMNLRVFMIVYSSIVRRFPNRTILLLKYHIYKKDVEPVPVTRSTFRGLRIAQLVETSNAESPTPNMYITTLTSLLVIKNVGVYKHIPGHLPLLRF